MPHAEVSGLGEFGKPAAGVLETLRRKRAGERAGLARATSRVRTSGVRFIPQRTLEAGAEERELGFLGNVGIRSALERIRDRRLREERGFRLQLADRGVGLNRAFRRRQLQSSLIAGGIGAVGSVLGGGLASRFGRDV